MEKWMIEKRIVLNRSFLCNIKKRWLTLLIFVCLSNLVYATDYYVDKNSIGGVCNNQNSGTIILHAIHLQW